MRKQNKEKQGVRQEDLFAVLVAVLLELVRDLHLELEQLHARDVEQRRELKQQCPRTRVVQPRFEIDAKEIADARHPPL